MEMSSRTTAYLKGRRSSATKIRPKGLTYLNSDRAVCLAPCKLFRDALVSSRKAKGRSKLLTVMSRMSRKPIAFGRPRDSCLRFDPHAEVDAVSHKFDRSAMGKMLPRARCSKNDCSTFNVNGNDIIHDWKAMFLLSLASLVPSYQPPPRGTGRAV